MPEFSYKRTGLDFGLRTPVVFLDTFPDELAAFFIPDFWAVFGIHPTFRDVPYL